MGKYLRGLIDSHIPSRHRLIWLHFLLQKLRYIYLRHMRALTLSRTHSAEPCAVPVDLLTAFDDRLADNSYGNAAISSKPDVVDAIDFSFLDGSPEKTEIVKNHSRTGLGRDRVVINADDFVVGAEHGGDKKSH